MEKYNYLKEWASGIQKKIWERDVFIAMLKEDKIEGKDLDALVANNEKEQKLLDFIDNGVRENSL